MSNQLPLSGISVVEFCQVAAGPFCGMLLSDFGADVIKIEPPEGDSLRQWPPLKDGFSENFAALNRGKQSVALNLKDCADLELARALVLKADVLVENNRPGAMQRLGLGWDWFRERKPSLIYCSISAYGQTGPRAAEGGFDLTNESAGGSLERFGRAFLGRDPYTATAGLYIASITGTVGTILPGSITTFKSDDDATSPGMLFVLDEDFEMTAGTEMITIRALEGGTGSLLAVGDKLTATAPINGAGENIIITAIDTAPQDEEDIEDYRQKALDSRRLEAQGGSRSDYRLWAEAVQGVRKVYPYAKSGAPNEVNVFVEAFDTLSTPKGVPTSDMKDDVDAYILQNPDTGRGRRPITVLAVHVLDVDVLDVDITVTDFVDLDADKEATIAAALAEYISTVRPYIAGADNINERRDTLDTYDIGAVIKAAVPGAQFGTITMEVDGNAETSYTFDNGEIPYYNSITYTP